VAASDRQPVRFSDWFALRRIRTALIGAVLLHFIVSLSRFADLALPEIHMVAPPQNASGSSSTSIQDKVKWNDFAYVQYITNGDYLCNSLMIMESLQRSRTRADRVMMYPEDWHISDNNTPNASIESKLLVQARDLYGAKLVPIQIQSFTKGDETWKDSYTKLLAFNQTQYKRVMSLDSDATVRKVGACSDLFTIFCTNHLTLGSTWTSCS
jgi:alpha-N-acetylglucosamine transferase